VAGGAANEEQISNAHLEYFRCVACVAQVEGARARACVDAPARRAWEFQRTPQGLRAKGMPTDAFADCPGCSDLADKNGAAPLAPGLTKTDERSPLLMVSGDGNSKATRFAYAGKAQDGVKPVCNYFFGRANERFEAAVSATEARTAAVAAGPEDRSCGTSYLRCVKAGNIRGGVLSSYGLAACNYPHGITGKGMVIDALTHGACARSVLCARSV
jgi:hypothetical protein